MYYECERKILQKKIDNNLSISIWFNQSFLCNRIDTKEYRHFLEYVPKARPRMKAWTHGYARTRLSGRARMTERNVMCVSAMRMWKCTRIDADPGDQALVDIGPIAARWAPFTLSIKSFRNAAQWCTILTRDLRAARFDERAYSLETASFYSGTYYSITLANRVSLLRHVGNDKKYRFWCGSMKTPGINCRKLTCSHARGNIETYLLHDVRSTLVIAVINNANRTREGYR